MPPSSPIGFPILAPAGAPGTSLPPAGLPAPQSPPISRQSPPVSPGGSTQSQLQRQLAPIDGQKADRLAHMLGMERSALDKHLPALRWHKQGKTYALRDKDGAARPLHLSGHGLVTELDAALIENADDHSPEAGVARELHQLMTDFAPDYVQALLLGKAAPVLIAGRTFQLPVTATGTHTARVDFPDGSRLFLVRPSAGNAYVPTDGPPSRQASPEAGEGPSGWLSRPGEVLDETMDPLYQPLFGLETGSEAARFIFEADDDAPPSSLQGEGDVGRPRKRARLDWDAFASQRWSPVPSSPQGEGDVGHPPKGARLDWDASASQRWSAYCNTRKMLLPAWAALDRNRQQLLQAAALSLPDKQKYAVLQQCEQAGDPVIGQAIVQAHREQCFLDVARGIAQQTERHNHSIQTLKKHIEALGEPAFQEVAQAMLDQAKADPQLQGNKPGTLKDGTAIFMIRDTLRFLENVSKGAKATQQKNGLQEAKAIQQTGQAWLQATLDEMLAHLPQEERVAPDPDTSKACMKRLAERLEMKDSSFRHVKPAIKALTGVDLAINNAWSERAAAPAPDNPVPPTGRGATLHRRFNALKLPANRSAFAGFFTNRNTIRGTADPANGNSYANNVLCAMQVLEQLESHKDADGNPAPLEVDVWLKGVFGRALGTTVTQWNDLGALTPKQIKAVRKSIQNDQGFSDSTVAGFCALIFHLTGVSLWTR